MTKLNLNFHFTLATRWQDKSGISILSNLCLISLIRFLPDDKKNYWVTLPFVAKIGDSESKDVISSLNQNVYAGELPDSALYDAALKYTSVALLLMQCTFSLLRVKIGNVLLLICLYLSFII